MERRKKRIVKLTAFLFLLAASIFVMPQKAFADENEDVTLPTEDNEHIIVRAILNPWNHSRMSPGLIHTGPMKAMSSAERSMNCIRFWRIV